MNASATAVERKPCTRCHAEKHLDAFRPGDGRHGRKSWCRTCERIYQALRREEPARRASEAAYLARPEVAERRRERERARPDRYAKLVRYRATPKGRLVNARARARARLRAATTEEGRACCAALVAAYDREIARLDRELAGRAGA